LNTKLALCRLFFVFTTAFTVFTEWGRSFLQVLWWTSVSLWTVPRQRYKSTSEAVDLAHQLINSPRTFRHREARGEISRGDFARYSGGVLFNTAVTVFTEWGRSFLQAFGGRALACGPCRGCGTSRPAKPWTLLISLQMSADNGQPPIDNGQPPRAQKKNPVLLSRDGTCTRLATIYSSTFYCSTIDAVGLNFSVRNGKRCSPTL
jgi:hypothetical protein